MEQIHQLHIDITIDNVKDTCSSIAYIVSSLHLSHSCTCIDYASQVNVAFKSTKVNLCQNIKELLSIPFTVNFY